MEVTPEMIKAVRAHENAEEQRKTAEYRAERLRRDRERQERLKAGAMAQVRTFIGGLTEETFEKLEEVFDDYLREKHDW